MLSSATSLGQVARSTDLAISAQGLGKKYLLGEFTGTGQYRTFREDVLRRLIGRRRSSESREFWALKDITFDVREGEVLGIIGRNGAGKSTLLKLLSRITAPTEGRARIRGRVGSLLEVGTGFHPELSGKENILLNGAVLGMSRRETLAKMEQIVDFAGVERFLETPVKRYSSGMYLRLAFAVAAHLEPDILLVDEVLAVGDAEFQKKCLGRMSEVGASGRTVIFISHSMPAVLRLCSRLLLIEKGRLVQDGPPSQVVSHYLDSGMGSAALREWPSPQTAPGDDVARLKSVRVARDDDTLAADECEIDRPINVEIDYWHLSNDPQVRPSVCATFYNENGTLLFHSHDFVNRQWRSTPRHEGIVRATCRLPAHFLAEGRHFISVGCSSYAPNRVHFQVEEAVSFQVADRTDGDGVRGEWRGEWPGVVRPMLDWRMTVRGQ